MNSPRATPLDLGCLRKCDLLNLLDCIAELQEHSDSTALPKKLLEILAKLMPSEIVGYNEMDVAGGRGIYYESSIGSPPDLMDALQRNIDQHPLIQHFSETHDGQARSISDFCMCAEFRRRSLHAELYRVLGVDDQIAITLLSDAGTLIGVTANREGWGFSPREKAMLTMLRPHIRAAHRNAQKIKALQDQADHWRRTIDQLPQGIAARDASGRWVWITDVAERIVRRHFPTWRPRPASMPDEINRWAAAQHALVERTLSPAQPFIVPGAQGRLTLRFMAMTSGVDLILFLEHSPAAASAALCNFGLTPREAQVMHWVLEGKTNPQIGVLLQVSRRTVQKHLERVFQKWQVDTRTRAAMHARQLLGG